MKSILFLTALYVNVFGYSNINCEQQYKNFIEYGSSEDVNDMKYALLSFKQMQDNNCYLDDDDYTIAVYILKYLQTKQEVEK